jgi:bacillithiol biosynthesis cysteine-adding enzyme BshC
MHIDRFQLSSLQHSEKIIVDYLDRSSTLKSFIQEYPSDIAFELAIKNRNFSSSSRQILTDELKLQYSALNPEKAVTNSIELLLNERTFTVTTGHQLCLFTGPMYFIFKIISTIKLAENLKSKFPENNFVPVYWMASEDHDFEEINHVWVHGKKLEWTNNTGGAVGRLSLAGIEALISQLEALLPDSLSQKEWLTLLRDSFSKDNLAEATQSLVHALFGKKGLIALNPDSQALKKLFAPVMKAELVANDGEKLIAYTTGKLQDMGYKTLVNARPINLFYLGKNFRGRIEKNEADWSVVSHDKQWNETELLEELSNHPENFSPNVVMRPLYQEAILPNLAYVGGPGEISYWMQFKSNFEHYSIQYPLLVLRDSALILNAKQNSKIQKIGIELKALFLDRNAQIAGLLPVADTAVEKEKESLSSLYAQLRIKAMAIDPTLEAFVNAEKQRQIQALEGVEKKMTKALKQREEVKIQQLDKVMEDLFPNGKLNERRDNIFPLLNEFGPNLLDELFANFDPLKGELKVLVME